MQLQRGAMLRILPLLALVFATLSASAQSGNAGTVRGTVSDPSGAVIPNATVHLFNERSGFDRTTVSDATGQFVISNVPFNPYVLDVSAKGFAPLSQNTEIDSVVGISLKLVLQVSGSVQTVTVESQGELIEDDPTFHVDVDRDMFTKVPLESASSTLSSLVTLTTPGVAADSNGLFHGLGDHASNSFSVDGQSITDQQSKVFSNQLPSNAIQSIEVISGAPPAEYGDKTSLVIVATTRSGQGVTKPTGAIYASYGVFRLGDRRLRSLLWRQKLGQLHRGRRPQHRALSRSAGVHCLPRQGQRGELLRPRRLQLITPADSIHLDLNYSRSWFQTPNAYDNLNVQNVRRPAQQRHQRQPDLWQCGQHRPALQNQDLSTSRPLIRASSVTTRSSTWASLSAGTL